MSAVSQFYNTSNRLIRDVTKGLGRDLKDPNWIGGFCLPMIGSFAHECGGFMLMEEGKPTVLGSLGGISFPQWTGMSGKGRRKAFMDLCRKLHLHPYGYDAALAMILYELMGSARGVVNATLTAPSVTVAAADAILGAGKGETCDRALLARVVKFEKLYEGAGVKHYPSRYAYAIKARDAFTAWARAGFPELEPFVMPKARFSVEFDKEFGQGVSATTARAAPALVAVPVIRKSVDPLDDALASSMPLAPTVKGRWPEDSLSAAEIKAIQQRLRDLGYVRVGQVDGKWGTNTTASIAALQADNGMKVDGHYGPASRAALAAGRPHVVSPERAHATTRALLAAGEPTLTAVQPVNIGSKALAVASAIGTAVSGVATIWPQASSTLDGLKETFANVPGWVWPLATLAVALYFYLTSRKVNAVAVDNFRSGANTALATPLDTRDDEGGVVLPPVPGAPVPVEDDPETEPDLHEVSATTVGSEPDRPLGTDDDEVPHLPDTSASVDWSRMSWADAQRAGQ